MEDINLSDSLVCESFITPSDWVPFMCLDVENISCSIEPEGAYLIAPEKGYVYYPIRCKCGTNINQVWTTWRRFSQFDALLKVVKRRIPEYPLIPSLPPKTWFSNFENGFVTRRSKMLNYFLIELLSIPTVLTIPEVRAFLGLNELRIELINTPTDLNVDTVVSVCPYMKIHEGKLDQVIETIKKMTAKTRADDKTITYSYALEESNEILFCRSSYEDAEGLIDAFSNVSIELEELLSNCDMTRCEIHGPHSEIELLKNDPTFEALKPDYYTLDEIYSNPFRRMPFKMCEDRLLEVIPYLKPFEYSQQKLMLINSDCCQSAVDEIDCEYYGFTFCTEKNLVHCREAYNSVSGIISHMKRVKPMLERQLQCSDIEEIAFHGPKELIEDLKTSLNEIEPKNNRIKYFVLLTGEDVDININDRNTNNSLAIRKIPVSQMTPDQRAQCSENESFNKNSSSSSSTNNIHHYNLNIDNTNTMGCSIARNHQASDSKGASLGFDNDTNANSLETDSIQDRTRSTGFRGFLNGMKKNSRNKNNNKSILGDTIVNIGEKEERSMSTGIRKMSKLSKTKSLEHLIKGLKKSKNEVKNVVFKFKSRLIRNDTQGET